MDQVWWKLLRDNNEDAYGIYMGYILGYIWDIYGIYMGIYMGYIWGREQRRCWKVQINDSYGRAAGNKIKLSAKIFAIWYLIFGKLRYLPFNILYLANSVPQYLLSDILYLADSVPRYLLFDILYLHTSYLSQPSQPLVV